MEDTNKRTPVHKVYYPLYEDKDKFIVLITGGRGSGKSFEMSRFLSRLTFEKNHRILYCRYTMTSASKSIIPEVMDKIDRDGTSSMFYITKDKLINRYTSSSILFMGIRSQSGNQTAKLKSIQGLSTFVCDEAEEWTSEEEFDKILLSVRQKGVRNRVIIVMNPSNTNHFVYRRYIENTHRIEVIDGIEVQISTHPNVLHIHTTYFDNMDYLDDNFIREVEDIKATNPDKYSHVVIGRWASLAMGAIYKEWEIVESIPTDAVNVAIGLDFGYTNDPSAGVRCATRGDELYIDELFYRSSMLSGDLITALKPYNLPVIADSADPRLIDEIKIGGINIHAVQKGSGSILAGIEKIQGMKIKVTKRSHNIIYELQNYIWNKDKEGLQINEPIDANNHAMDAIRYYVLSYILGQRPRPIRTTYKGIFR